MRTIVVALALAACTPGSKGDAPHALGSATVAAQGRHVYTVNAWDGTLSHLDWDTGLTKQLEIGGEPTRVAKVGVDELWVTLRAERAILVFDIADGAPRQTDRIATGAEPHGVVSTPDGSRVYVAMSQQDEVFEYDGASRERLRTWKVMDDPRWLALHPSGRALFVTHAFTSKVERIDLEDGSIDVVDPPQTERPTDGGPIELQPRPTGDPAISDYGDALVVPTLFVDNTTPVEQPDETGQPPSGGGGYGSPADTSIDTLSIGRMNPALVGIPLDPDDGRVLRDEPIVAFFVGGTGSRGEIERGYVSSATFAPDGHTVYATLEAANAVAVVDLRPLEDQGMDPSAQSADEREFADTGFGSEFTFPSAGGFFERRQHLVKTAGNPAGVAFDGDGFAWVDERGDRTASWIDDARVRRALEDEIVGGGTHEVAGNHQLGRSLLDPDVEKGRRLFYSADDDRMAGRGAGVSCSTCHTDGRNDGVTWTFDDGRRQTPSLAGPVGLTAPVTWTRGVESVGAEAQITSKGRMGGRGLRDGEAAFIDAFVNASREVDVATKGADDELVRLGAEVFAREEVGCASCHSGARLTDNLAHDVFGLSAVSTPALVGVDATAPYLHDGSAPTLGALLLRLKDGSMGSTASLDARELEALEAYLRSL